ncbi:MAG: hypothetical protein VB125_05165, partial [Burkholderia sp.]
AVFSQVELDDIAWKMNTRPRKSLGWKCPAELFMPESFDVRQHASCNRCLGGCPSGSTRFCCTSTLKPPYETPPSQPLTTNGTPPI